MTSFKETSFKEIAAVSTSNRAAWSYIRKHLRMSVAKGDTVRLFNAVIRDMQGFLNDNGEIDNLEGLYQSIASKKVNNPKSSFYIYG